MRSGLQDPDYAGPFSPCQELGFYPKYDGDLLNDFSELINSLENQYGCCGKKEQKWEDQSMGDAMSWDFILNMLGVGILS